MVLQILSAKKQIKSSKNKEEIKENKAIDK